MKFTVATVLAFAAVAFAYPAVNNEHAKRQSTVSNVDVSVPAMSDQAGNVIAFDANNVYKDASAKGI